MKLPKGFKKTNLVSHEQKVYSDGKRWITPDKDGHNGGVWKVYDNPNDVGKNKKHRDETYDSDLNKIGN
ncbi:toxin C-terminal domain-containing protein [Chitinophaga caeni]|uniref:toxin C-terminal domain-containing protein n=1 Tax=Chitinophaga caeni TaxID=2029983 RepID=UPI0012FDCBCE